MSSALRLCLVLLLTASGLAAARADGLADQRAAFKRGWAVAQQGDFKALVPYLRQLHDYPLYPYLGYAYLKATLDTAPDGDVEQYIERYYDLPLSNELRQAWLLKLAQRQDWPHVLAYYRDETDPALRCAAVSAHLLKSDEPDHKAWVAPAKELWLSLQTPAELCAPLFTYLRANKLINGDLLRKRMLTALQQRDYGDARLLLPQMNIDDRGWAELWLDMAANPSRQLADIQVPDEWYYQEMLLSGVRLVARENPARADGLWSQLEHHYHFSFDDGREMRTVLALQHAWHLLPDGRSRLKQLRDSHDPAVPEWRARLAIRDGDWRGALSYIRVLPDADSSPEWRYWKARALAALGRHDEADALYAQLARDHDYYGFLAADRAHLRYAINQHVSQPDDGVIEHLQMRPGFVRARELYYAGLFGEAEQEWSAATAALNTPQRCQAALLAERWGWHGRVIPIMASGDCWQDLQLIYPVAFGETLLPQAHQLKLDLPWIYGVIRTESVFRPNAVSYAGARGLMQLMPSTGLDIAERIGLHNADPEALLDPPTNLQLGAAYLKSMLQHFEGSEPRATAAYNAGPERVDDWLPAADGMAADVWIDTIPYDQTRTYVHRVMGHTVIFDWRINGTPEPLSLRIAKLDEGPADEKVTLHTASDARQ